MCMYVCVRICICICMCMCMYVCACAYVLALVFFYNYPIHKERKVREAVVCFKGIALICECRFKDEYEIRTLAWMRRKSEKVIEVTKLSFHI